MYIHKIQIDAVSFSQNLMMPADAKILSVQKQYGEPVVYYTTKNPKVKRVRDFFAITTGNPVPDDVTYIGTLLFDDDTFVAHFYVGN